eukprot:Gb_05537 [translate_table: standard]
MDQICNTKSIWIPIPALAYFYIFLNKTKFDGWLPYCGPWVRSHVNRILSIHSISNHIFALTLLAELRTSEQSVPTEPVSFMGTLMEEGNGRAYKEVKPRPNGGIVSWLIDVMEKMVVRALYDSTKPLHYLSGNFAPVPHETAPQPHLPVIGHLPKCLDGEFVRVGPNPKFAPVAGYHWLLSSAKLEYSVQKECFPLNSSCLLGSSMKQQINETLLASKFAPGNWPSHSLVWQCWAVSFNGFKTWFPFCGPPPWHFLHSVPWWSPPWSSLVGGSLPGGSRGFSTGHTSPAPRGAQAPTIVPASPSPLAPNDLRATCVQALVTPSHLCHLRALHQAMPNVSHSALGPTPLAPST